MLEETFGASQVVLVVKNPPANTGDIRDVDSIPESGRSPRGGNGNPLQCSCLENPHGQRRLADTLLRSLPLSSQAFLLPVCLCPDFLPFIKMPVTGLCACVLCVCSVAQSCLTLCSPMDCSSPVSSIHGILQARRLVGCHALLQEIFLTQRSNPHFLHFLHCRWTRYH